jgi:hypothetical protein
MNNNILNIGLKSLVAIIIIIGAILTVTLVKGGNPSAYDNQDIVRLGTEVAIGEGKNDELSQVELDRFIMEEGLKIKAEREKEVQANVNTIMNFTFYVLGAVILVLVFGTIFSVVGDFKKSIIGIVSTVGFLVIVYVIYVSTSNEVPAEYLAAETKELADNPDFVAVYTPSNWKMVSASFTISSMLIIVAGFLAVAGWVKKVLNF